MRFILFVLLGFAAAPVFAQLTNDAAAQKWADSVYQTFTEDERIGQLIVTRLSTMDMKTKKISFLYDQTADYVKKYNIGSICLFQGSPTQQAIYLNQLKAMAKTPLLISIDGEWGLGQRILDSVIPLPRQMMLGAVKDSSIIYRYGKVVAEQCKRLGIQNNYAPVMDVNNNPDNPVINDRSFGEDKNKVASFGIQYMKGMQDNGVLACAKHFPGHGDVAVDSHLDLPVIKKTMDNLEAVELFPFKSIFKAGIGSVMVGHLFIPAIDSTANRPTSLSSLAVQELLRKKIGYQGLTITDGLEMQGVKKFFPNGEASVQSIIAGNDLLCVPDSVPLVVEKIHKAILDGRLNWDIIQWHCKRILMTKYKYVLQQNQAIDLNHLTTDINKDVLPMRRLVAENAITLLAKEDKGFFPLNIKDNKDKTAYVAVGISGENAMVRKMKSDYNAGVFYFDFKNKNADSVKLLIDSITQHYQKVVIGIHQINRAPANNFGINKDAVDFINTLQHKTRSMILLFGNAYAAKNWCFAKNLMVAYEDDSTVQYTAVDLLQGKIKYKGSLPVTVCEHFKYGFGMVAAQELERVNEMSDMGFNADEMNRIDSIALDGIKKKAMPGCLVMVASKGKIIYEKGFGNFTYDGRQKVTASSVYDLASLTKILSTTLCIMKLYDEGKIDIKKKLGQYLPAVEGTAKADIVIEKLLLHEAGLKPFIPYYKETLDSLGQPLSSCYAPICKDCYATSVAQNLFFRNDLLDSFYHKVVFTPAETIGKYVYSDNDFILLGKLVEQVSGESLDGYAKRSFYEPMGLESMGYRPLEHVSFDRIVPSTVETQFRKQELRGYVHDQGAALMGGVAGHAGLFSDAYDIACIMQMLLNGGNWGNRQLLTQTTIDLFTSYQSDVSRRGFGFDKPEKDNATRTEPYPALSASPATFGHTGFTGTCAWADPEHQLVFVFLSNRIYPEDNGVFKTLNIRPKMMELVYQVMKKS